MHVHNYSREIIFKYMCAVFLVIATRTDMKVGVIGTGTAGLWSDPKTINCIWLRSDCIRAKWQNREQTWSYTDENDKDKYGVDVHSSMYQGLLSNIPKEIMAFPDFPFKLERSVVTLSGRIFARLRCDFQPHQAYQVWTSRHKTSIADEWKVEVWSSQSCSWKMWNIYLRCCLGMQRVKEFSKEGSCTLIPIAPHNTLKAKKCSSSGAGPAELI